MSSIHHNKATARRQKKYNREKKGTEKNINSFFIPPFHPKAQ